MKFVQMTDKMLIEFCKKSICQHQNCFFAGCRGKQNCMFFELLKRFENMIEKEEQMKNYIVKIRIKFNECDVGVSNVFVRDSNEEFAGKVALNFFSDKYDCEIIEVKEN